MTLNVIGQRIVVADRSTIGTELDFDPYLMDLFRYLAVPKIEFVVLIIIMIKYLSAH